MPSRPLLGAALLCLLAGAAAHSANPCPSVAAWEGGDLSVIEGEWLVAEFECSKEVFAVDGTSVTWSYLDYDGQKGTSTFNITAPGKFYQGDSQMTLIDAVPEEFIMFYTCWDDDAMTGEIEALVKPSANIAALYDRMEQRLARLEEDNWTADFYMWEPEQSDCPSSTTTAVPVPSTTTALPVPSKTTALPVPSTRTALPVPSTRTALPLTSTTMALPVPSTTTAQGPFSDSIYMKYYSDLMQHFHTQRDESIMN